MDLFLTAFDDIPDPRADNARHDLGELLVIAFVSVLCGATSCAGMARQIWAMMTKGEDYRDPALASPA